MPADALPGTPSATEPNALSFPRQFARTLRFTSGAPRAFTVSPDGARVVFLRSRSGEDAAGVLWAHDVATGEEFEVGDPAVLLGGAAEELSAEERARRERSRESGAGVVGYACDAATERAAFALSGRLFVTDLTKPGTARELPAEGPVVDPRPSPDGRLVAYVAGGALHVVAADGTSAGRALAEPESAEVTWGLAEFVAAEEMDRTRGFWWSPQGDRLLVARADTTPVQRWWISDPAHPGSAPTAVPYPQTGTPNADVSLHLVDVEGGGRTEVRWDREAYPYLARVHWSAAGAPLLLVQARHQREQRYLGVDAATGATRELLTERDEAWVELHAGVPVLAPTGALVRIGDTPEGRVLTAGDRALTGGGALHVRAVLDVGEHDVLFTASAGAEVPDPPVGDIGVYRVPLDGSAAPERLGAADDGGPHGAPHVASAARGGDVLALTTATLGRRGARTVLLHTDGRTLGEIASHAAEPSLRAAPRLLHAGRRAIPCAVLLPEGHREGDGPLPVLMDPYGGPHGQRVVAAHNPYLTSQWFANQGFAVVVADGRGTPGRSPGWEKAVNRQLADVTLEDQVDALHALAESFPLDLTRVGIRGWSFGGYLAALAALRRPDVFHAAVVGAPVTDLRLYDTHYQERYMGTPQAEPEVYAANSLVTDEGLSRVAEGPHRPMMIIHGLADDNVLVAHSLRLSSALLAAGRPHEVLPLTGVTHMTPQEEIAENLLLLQAAFLKRELTA